jgi:molybdopterin/thiamine biosynthesis adenylyltransferase
MEDLINIMRHESVFNPKDHNYPIHIIGAGATGSRVFAALVELGITNITVYDPDVVEDHNLANQIYMVRDISYPKVDGCMRFAADKLGSSHANMTFSNRKVTEAYIREGYMKGGVVFLLTDTMDSRREIANALVARCFGPEAQLATAPLLIIETRMASTHGAVFSINPFDREAHRQWLSTLVDDNDTDSIEVSPCGTALSVGTTASLIANYAVWQMMQFFVDPVGLQPRVDLFFKPTLTITSPAIAA